jgi:hypothetical protein
MRDHPKISARIGCESHVRRGRFATDRCAARAAAIPGVSTASLRRAGNGWTTHAFWSSPSNSRGLAATKASRVRLYQRRLGPPVWSCCCSLSRTSLTATTFIKPRSDCNRCCDGLTTRQHAPPPILSCRQHWQIPAGDTASAHFMNLVATCGGRADAGNPAAPRHHSPAGDF